MEFGANLKIPTQISQISAEKIKSAKIPALPAGRPAITG